MDITDFLLARIEEDEVRANYYGRLAMGTGRVLAECAAKRALTTLHSPGNYRGQEVCNDCGDWWDGSPIDYPCETIKILTAVYKDHPNYQEEWATHAPQE